MNPGQAGTKCAFWYTLTVRPQESATVRLFDLGGQLTTIELDEQHERYSAKRKAEADEFYRALTPAGASADEASVMRQAFAGMLWSKQFYHYRRRDPGLDGDPRLTAATAAGRKLSRSRRWRSCTFDIMSMPDKWGTRGSPPGTWPSCVALSLDPGFAKYQLGGAVPGWFATRRRCRPGGTSATSTRQSERRGRRSRCSR